MKAENDIAVIAHQAYCFFNRHWKETGLESIGLGSFPLGWCADASIILGRYYQESNFGTVEIIRGSLSRFRTHAWLFVSDRYVDITLSQFPEARRSVYISESPPSFVTRIESRHSIDSEWGGIPHAALLENAYQLFRDALSAP